MCVCNCTFRPMKRFTLISALILTVGVFTLAFAEMPKEKQAVKYEVSVTIDTPSVELSANDEAIKTVELMDYIIEPNGRSGERLSSSYQWSGKLIVIMQLLSSSRQL